MSPGAEQVPPHVGALYQAARKRIAKPLAFVARCAGIEPDELHAFELGSIDLSPQTRIRLLAELDRLARETTT